MRPDGHFLSAAEVCGGPSSPKGGGGGGGGPDGAAVEVAFGRVAYRSEENGSLFG